MSAARDALWASGHDETVEVNQRALIDKVLARYSGEFTVFRELLQNSDDAASRAVEIRFETKEYLDRTKTAKDAPGNEQEQADDVAHELSGAEGKLPDLKTALVHQWTFRNNGMVFKDDDWNRLKKIAEGNPDEEKIGAFGVGFYSLFSVTEEPFVSSGGRWMGFYWKDKKDQLYARRGDLPPSVEPESDSWTTFEMTLREPTPIPAAFDFTRFLVSSITFMSHLSEVSVFFDDHRLVRLSKDSGLPSDVPLLRGLKSSSPTGIMNVRSIQTTPLTIKAEVARWVYSVGTDKPSPAAPKVVKSATGFFSSLFSGFGGNITPARTPTPNPIPLPDPVNLLEITKSGVILSIFSANIEVKLDKKLGAELFRSTKKQMPSKMRYELIYTGKNEYDDSVREEQELKFSTGSVFQGLRADLDGLGSARIFIGHSTGQTTGIGGHMAARFIPTVERESIDLVDRNVAIWNKELLHVGGFLARSAYEVELFDIKKLWDSAIASGDSDSHLDQGYRDKLHARALHALKFFTFHSSTPSPIVSSSLEGSFFTCATNRSFPIMSSEGVRNAADVRVPDASFEGFLKKLPIIPDDISIGARSMIESLQRRGMIKEISFIDVLEELRHRPLSEPEMIACLKWWIGMQKQSHNTNLLQIRTQLLEAAVVTIGTPGTKDEKIITLSTVQTFLNTRHMGSYIPTDGPLPGDLLPISISRSFDPEVLSLVFPWKQLTIIDWLSHVMSPSVAASAVDYDVTQSAPWSERVLMVLARAWPTLSKAAQEDVIAMLRTKPFVPTSAGLKLPEHAYFSSVNLFRDLPIVTLPSGTPVKGPVEKFLQALGVRKHVELQIVFDRMIKTGDWTIIDLVKYLVSVQSTLTQLEIERLQHTAAFTRQDEKPIPTKNGVMKIPRHKASDLYEPLDVFRELKLPVIDWGIENKWRQSSEEAKFLHSLGLKRFPPLSVLIDIAAGVELALRPKALRYLLDNFVLKYAAEYNPHDCGDRAFIPAIKTAQPCMAKPSEVFSNPDWMSLGFTVVHPDLRGDSSTKLKVPNDPPTFKLVSLLERTPPKDENEARNWFEILATRIPEFSSDELKKLAALPFIPVKGTPPQNLARRLCPNQCYFTGSSGADFHSKLFVFVDFGSRANTFLSACGTKREPSVEEIVRILLRDPQEFYKLAQGSENYLLELRNIAVNRRLLSSNIIALLKRAPVLLGIRRVKKAKAPQKDQTDLDVDEDDWEPQDQLMTPGRVLIADDMTGYQLFGDSMFCAPQEDLLEEFYASLGSRRLSALIQEKYEKSGEITTSKEASKTKQLILERLPLFLHEHTHARTRVSFNWFRTGNNFIVKTFGKLRVTKALTYDGTQLARTQDASAVAVREGGGPIQLWLAGHTQVDMYEVSTSLCRFLFESPKPHDALLLMTILDTPLKALKARGYNVDRILRQQKAEREAAEKAAQEWREAEAKAAQVARETMEKSAFNANSQLIPSNTTSTKPVPVSALQSPPLPHASQSIPPENLHPRPPSAGNEGDPSKGPASQMMKSLDAFKRRLVKKSDQPLPPTPIPIEEPRPRPSSSLGADLPGKPGSELSLLQKSRTPTPAPQTHVTPLSNIALNINMAIRACQEETSSFLRNREHMQMVKESLDEGYCDVSGRAGDLDFVGISGGFKIYASHDIVNRESLVDRRHDSLTRFTPILDQLRAVYKLPSSSLHIFCDVSGQLIAFNRNGSLFVNLRYYEAWHDNEVHRGDLTKAYISWYFTLAHEIAHNLVQQHNSEHEFYFSSICESYMLPLTQILAAAEVRT